MTWVIKPLHLKIQLTKELGFLDHSDLKLVSQSEEHGVIETENWENYIVGDILLGIPYHICPTVNLYHEAQVIKKHHEWTGTWKIEDEDRKITV